jgi:hypothetical protein
MRKVFDEGFSPDLYTHYAPIQSHDFGVIPLGETFLVRPSTPKSNLSAESEAIELFLLVKHHRKSQ